MNLTVLGSQGAIPKLGKYSTSLLLNISNSNILIDCCEGVQHQLRKYKIKLSKIDIILISHAHGDHYFGLFGLIGTFNLLGRTEPLDIFGPTGLKEIILMSLKIGASWTKFPLRFHELNQNESALIFEDEKVTVRTLPLDHRIYTNGFLFEQKPKPRILNPQVARELEVSSAYFNKAKQGHWVQDNAGNPVDFRAITHDPPKQISYAYCSDTAFYPPLAQLIKGVTLLYHESTFLSQHEDLCGTTKHSTASQAAEMAQEAKAKFLLLGHYSGRYKSLADFKIEATKVFPQVYLARENAVFTLEDGGVSELTEI